MSETWTPILAQDDPGSGHQAVAKGRAYRDNDECLHRVFSCGQSSLAGITGLNQTYPNRVATGCKIRFYKPPYAKKVSFKFYIAKQTIGAVRTWALVRFNNDAALETPLQDTNVSAAPWSVTDFDLSSLAEGVYDAEIFAGHAGVSGDQFVMRLPSGRLPGQPVPPSVADDSDILSPFQWGTVDWAVSPSSDITDTELTSDKGHTQTVAQKWYDRDEKLRRRPMSIASFSGNTTAVHPTFSSLDLPKIYVPRYGDVLALSMRFRTDAGGTLNAYLSCKEMEAEFPFWTPNVSGAGVSTSSSTDVFLTIRCNMAAMRGREVTPRIWFNNSTTGKTSYLSGSDAEGGHRWEPQPISGYDRIRPDWRDWPSTGRLQGAMLSASWWRRMTLRDLDLQERPFLQRAFSFTASGAFVPQVYLNDSQISLKQPVGSGAAGAKMIQYLEIANTAPWPVTLQLDYLDLPDGFPTANARQNLLDGKYRLELPLKSSRDGSTYTFAIFIFGGTSGTIYRVQGVDACRARIQR